MIENFSKTSDGFVICHVCGRSFSAVALRRYTVKEKDGIGAIVGNTYYDAFDCPYCECQNVVGLRLDQVFVKPHAHEEDEGDEPTEDVTVTTETSIETEIEATIGEDPEEPKDYMNE